MDLDLLQFHPHFSELHFSFLHLLIISRFLFRKKLLHLFFFFVVFICLSEFFSGELVLSRYFLIGCRFCPSETWWVIIRVSKPRFWSTCF